MRPVTRDLYLDLLVKCVSNLIYGPPPLDPWNDGLFRADARSGRNRHSPAHTMVGILRLENVRELGQRAIDLAIPGDFIETGVWRGGCCILMRGILAVNAIKDRRVYAIDSFAGLPPPKPDLFPLDEGLNLHLYAELAVSLEQVQANFARYDLLDEQVIFVKGLFQETLPSLDAGPFALIRLDGDLYESTYVTLENLYPKLSPGGFIIIDDYKLLTSVKAAVTDYRNRMGIEWPMHDIDWNAVWWRKGKV
jgi:O-methyltransferase